MNNKKGIGLVVLVILGYFFWKKLSTDATASNPDPRPAARHGNLQHPVVVDPQNPHANPTLYNPRNNPLTPTTATDSGLEIGSCLNPLNNNSTYISILTGSIMPVTGILTFLDNMRSGYNRGESNPNSSGCRFLRLRQTHHINELNGTITSPNHIAIKQAKVDFLTATINNCCCNSTTTATETLGKTKTNIN